MGYNVDMENEVYYTKTLEDFLEEDKKRFPDTLNEFLDFCVDKFRDRPFMGKAFETPITFKEFYNKVLSITDMLMKRGIKKGDRIALLGENSPHWGITYFAIIRAGAIAVPILPDFPEADIRHILSNSEAKILFISHKQLEKMGDLDLKTLKSIIMLDEFDEETSEIKKESLTDNSINTLQKGDKKTNFFADPNSIDRHGGILGWGRRPLFDKAVDFLKKIPETIGLVSREVSEEDTASIIYTSGTSGHSKAVMLTHKNLISNVVAISTLVDVWPEDIFLSILPLSHTYEFTLGFLLPLVSGSRIVYLGKAPTPRILEKVCKIEKPTGICAVPLILEKIYKKKVLPGLKKNLMVKMVTKIPGFKKTIYKKITKKLIDFFGGHLRIMAIGGAPFNAAAEKFYRAAGFPYIAGYGLTETAPLLAGGPWGDKSIKVSSSGKTTPGCEIKIVDPDKKTSIGEIYGRGPNVMKGYFKNPELTAEVLDKEGWFKTGDLGYFDKQNNLYITGRSKNMILMPNGENIYPEAVEEKLNASAHVMESLVFENNDQLEAWVYLDYDLIDNETRGKSERQRLEYIEQVLADTKENINSQLSSFSKLSRILEHKEPFVKTATHKIKRYLYTHPQKKK